MALRNTIKKFLDSRGISTYQMQKDTGIAPNTAYGLAKDPSKIPSGAVLDRICEVYEIQPGELLEWENNPTDRRSY